MSLEKKENACELATVPRVTFTVLRASDLCHKVRRHSVRVVARRYSKRQSGFFGRTGDAGRGRALPLEISCDEVDRKNTRYLSGVMFSQAPLLDDMKYRMYKVSSEVDRLAALDDTRNTRLTYAKEMKGENGSVVEVEIVYEFFQKFGGGISVDLSQVMGCRIPEDENKEEYKSKSRAIADSTSAHISNDVVVVQVKQSTLRESQYLPVRPNCDQGTNSTTIKMSTQFICAATLPQSKCRKRATHIAR